MEKERLEKARSRLKEFSEARKALELRILTDEEWYRRRNYDERQLKLLHDKHIPIFSPWEMFGIGGAGSGRVHKPGREESTSAFLFKAIRNKHSDAMDNIPNVYVRPREANDIEASKILRDVLNPILKRAGFEEAYDANWIEKPKHGTGVYGVFWDDDKEDLSIKAVELLRLFWQPGINDIQDSSDMFYLTFVPGAKLKNMYPKIRFSGVGVELGAPITPPRYIDENTYELDEAEFGAELGEVPNMACVVDWYYKKMADRDGKRKEILHLCRFVGNQVLFCSEDEDGYDNGWYEDGRFPFVFDVMYAEKGTPAGYGLISTGRGEQQYIDRLDSNIIRQALNATKPLYLYDGQMPASIKTLEDDNVTFLYVDGVQLAKEHLLEWTRSPPDTNSIAVRQQKISELKELTSNRDISDGGTVPGIKTASGMSLMKAAADKSSRDFIQESWRCFEKITQLALSRIRQFYTDKKIFRIAGDKAKKLAEETLVAQYENEAFVMFDAEVLRSRKEYRPVSSEEALTLPFGEKLVRDGNRLLREVVIKDYNPEFDIEISSQSKNPVSQIQDNETVMNLLSAGLLNPGNEELLLTVCELIDVGNKEALIAHAEKGQTYQKTIEGLMMSLTQIMQLLAQASQAGMVPPELAAQIAQLLPAAGGGQTAGTGGNATSAPGDEGGNTGVSRQESEIIEAATGGPPQVKAAGMLGATVAM
jgi:hypothetical protein